MVIIKAQASIISSIIQKYAILQRLFRTQRVNLVALDPNGQRFYRYNVVATWEPLEAGSLSNAV